MRFFFIVQGEGRGHMTQAISLHNILVKNGHEVCHVVVGKIQRRNLPPFFRENIDAPISELDSPNFVTDKKGKSVKIIPSVIFNLFKIGFFLSSINTIHSLVKKDQPDVIVNFYDFLGGLYFMLKKTDAEHITLAHQFFLDHPTFNYPKGRLLDKVSLKLGNKIISYKARKILALSFQEFSDFPKKNLTVVPPLLREEVKTKKISQESHFLVYLVNHGYYDQIEKFHEKNPDIPIHCFWDKSNALEVEKRDKNLSFHQLNDEKFIDLLSSCRGYLTTAGFESVCEAMYMGKPTLMVPVKGHYEQSCNAVDAQNAGAGISSEIFELETLLAYISDYKNVQGAFQEWCSKTEQLFIQNLTHVN